VSRGSTRRYRANRAAILAGATICHLCGEPPRPNDPLVADHVVPRSKGGHDGPGNLRPAHDSCNQRRGNQPIEPMPPVTNPPARAGQPDPTPAERPDLIFEKNPDTGEMNWWPRWSRDW
jgi:5-methylcytosine-specific restriction endonuclease McrA